MTVFLVVPIIMTFLMKNQEYAKLLKILMIFILSISFYLKVIKTVYLEKIVKVGNTIIKKENIQIKIMVYDCPYLKEQQDCIIAKHTCDYWLKELNIEQFSNLCKDYAINNF